MKYCILLLAWMGWDADIEGRGLGPGLNYSNFQDSSEELNEIPSKENLDNLFGPLYEEYYATRTSEVSDNSIANTLDNEDTPSSSSIIIEDHDAPQRVSSLEQPIANEPTTPVFDNNSDEQIQKDVAELDGNTFMNPFTTPEFEEAKVDGKTQMYLTFGKMLKNFDREDLEVLWSIVKARFKKAELVNYMDNLLLYHLKTMFEHHVEDNVWKNQQGLVKVLNWKLYDSCGVHCVTVQSIPFYLLVEKIYPLTNHTLHQMFNDVKLQVDYECEMAFELLRLVKKQLKEGYGKIVGIKRLLDDLKVTAAKVYVTAAKLNYNCSKIKTAERVSTIRERIKTEERINIEFDLLKWNPTRGILQLGQQSSTLRKSLKVTIKKKKHVSTAPPPLSDDRERDDIAEATLLSLTLHKTAKIAEEQGNLVKILDKILEEDVEKIIKSEDEESYASEFTDLVFLDEEDLGTRLEPESHKEKSEIVDDDDEEEEEKKDDKKDDDNDEHDDQALVKNKVTGSSEVRNEKMQIPIPSPPRSPRTYLSSDKTISQELTAPVSPTPGTTSQD
ncbi:hypothetical protein Tco_0682793 [Tanacetum coccineum]|uniref:Uncharacterized protein n=1 Tax=Tanacetum coccineum TaxID=301880 RepID=A0ABQ4XTK2_9ASTR